MNTCTHIITKRLSVDETNSCSHHHITINMVNLNVKWTFIFAILASSFTKPIRWFFFSFSVSLMLLCFGLLLIRSFSSAQMFVHGTLQLDSGSCDKQKAFRATKSKHTKHTQNIQNNGTVIAVVCSCTILSIYS